ncbi:hypothetical protein WDV76_16540 [Xenorhabdus griffiniae]
MSRIFWNSSGLTRTIKQQYQRQQDQLSEIKLRMRELIGDYKSR